nr:DUF2399 domain-containing protein [Ornithinimicrobium sp. CNJ-824]
MGGGGGRAGPGLAHLPRAGAAARGGRPAGPSLTDAAGAGDPVHLSAWDLRRAEGLQPVVDAPVLVCENPRVLEAVAERRVEGWVVVCTAGEPNLVVDEVLGLLAAAGGDLRYHGDFDWPGLALAERAVGRHGVRPWLMGVPDYLAGVAVGGPQLVGTPVEPSWDPSWGPRCGTTDTPCTRRPCCPGCWTPWAAGGRPQRAVGPSSGGPFCAQGVSLVYVAHQHRHR